MSEKLVKKILAVVNGTEASLQSVEYAILLAKECHCAIKAVYVVDTTSIKKLQFAQIFHKEESVEYIEDLTVNGSAYLDYVKELGNSKGVTVETVLREGTVWSEVVSQAREDKTNLILIGGTDYAGSMGKDPISETYRELLINAPCSVLMVREKAIDTLFKMVE